MNLANRPSYLEPNDSPVLPEGQCQDYVKELPARNRMGQGQLEMMQGQIVFDPEGSVFVG